MRRVERYQAPDGKLFDSRKKAEEYVADKCREIVAKRLPIEGCPVNEALSAMTDRYKVVMALIPDYAAAAKLVGELSAWTQSGNDHDLDDDDE